MVIEANSVGYSSSPTSTVRIFNQDLLNERFNKKPLATKVLVKNKAPSLEDPKFMSTYKMTQTQTKESVQSTNRSRKSSWNQLVLELFHGPKASDRRTVSDARTEL